MSTQSSLTDFQDQIESIETSTGKSYRAIQMETFTLLGTQPLEWHSVSIKDILSDPTNNHEIIIWDLPSDYTEVPHPRFPEDLGSRCQLCGHPIIRLFFLLHDQRKQILQVGSECVNTFVGAHFVETQIKTFKDNRIRQKYRSWRGLAIDTIEKHREPARVHNLPYTNTPFSLRREGWLPEPYYSLLKKINKTDTLKSTSRVLNNLMNKGNKLLFRGEPQ